MRNWIGLGERTEAGIRFSIQRILRLGIILLGLRLNLQDATCRHRRESAGAGHDLHNGSPDPAHFAGRLFFRFPLRLAALIGVGTAICGNTAIVATAPVTEASDEEVSFAVATITLFGLLAVLFYPIIGHASVFRIVFLAYGRVRQ